MGEVTVCSQPLLSAVLVTPLILSLSRGMASVHASLLLCCSWLPLRLKTRASSLSCFLLSFASGCFERISGPLQRSGHIRESPQRGPGWRVQFLSMVDSGAAVSVNH